MIFNKMSHVTFFSASCSLDEPLCMAAWVTVLIVAAIYILYKVIKFCKHKPEDIAVENNPEFGQPLQHGTITTTEEIPITATLKPPDQESADFTNKSVLALPPTEQPIHSYSHSSVNLIQSEECSAA